MTVGRALRWRFNMFLVETGLHTHTRADTSRCHIYPPLPARQVDGDEGLVVALHSENLVRTAEVYLVASACLRLSSQACPSAARRGVDAKDMSAPLFLPLSLSLETSWARAPHVLLTWLEHQALLEQIQALKLSIVLSDLEVLRSALFERVIRFFSSSVVLCDRVVAVKVQGGWGAEAWWKLRMSPHGSWG